MDDGESHAAAHHAAVGEVIDLGRLATGAVVDVDYGINLEVPPPGESIAIDVIYTDYSSLTVVLDSDAQGEVTLSFPDHAAHGATASASGGSCLDACTDQSFKTTFSNKARWRTRYDWRYNHSNSPKGRNRSIDAFKNGINGIVRSRNDCGLSDQVSATARYRGETTRRPAPVFSAGMLGCNSNRLADGVNTVGWGLLGPSLLAAACVRTSGDAIVEADMTYHRGRDWFTGDTVPASCANRHSLRAVSTHEAGHTFGLGHSGCAQTMAPNADTCDVSIRTLGRGDVLGLRSLY
ncbi:MAG: matrixin family metalloprotease [Myxococcota bacterium]